MSAIDSGACGNFLLTLMRKPAIAAFVFSGLMIWGALVAWRVIAVDVTTRADSDTPHLAATVSASQFTTVGIVGDDDVDADGVATPRTCEFLVVRPESRRVAVSAPPPKLTDRRAATLIGVVVFRI